MTQTRREYLVSRGLAKPGRGKFSHAAKVALIEAAEQGIVFSDGEIVPRAKPAVKPTGGETENQPAAKSAGISDYLFPTDFCWPESEYRAFARVGGKKVYHGMRECCNNCRVSLVMCACGQPTIHGNIAVEFERR